LKAQIAKIADKWVLIWKKESLTDWRDSYISLSV
jgi:hypothetical protein